MHMGAGNVSHPCSGRVRDVPVPDSERELKSLKISLRFSQVSNKTLYLQAFYMEARVGIGRLMPCFQGKTTPLSELIQYNFALLALTRFNLLIEDLLDWDMRSLEQLFVMDTS